MRKFLYACIFLAVFVSCSAYAETLTLRTYYPVPFGNYERLRLVPRSNLSGACPIGTMYVESPDVMKFCSDDGSGSGTWGSLGGVWTQGIDGYGSSIVYLTDSNPNISVGIGTNVPEFKLSLNNDGGIIAKGTFGLGKDLPDLGVGTRMVWYPKKAAFRVGRITVTGDVYWDDLNVGNNSIAMGVDTLAKGNSSTALGFLSSATGSQSTAIGYSTLASGDYSTAMGNQTIASGSNSTAMGNQTTSSGGASTSTGYRTIASGNVSIAMGNKTIASGIYSTAMGNQTNASGDQSTSLGNATTASGVRSTAMGDSAIASGQQSTAIGHTTTASGNMSTSMGYFTTASGVQSTAMGTSTIAKGWLSTSLGRYTTASSFASLTIGSYNVDLGGNIANWVLTDPLFIIGNGADAANLSNAVTVLKNGRVGIGVASPETVFHIQTVDNTPLFKITSNASAEMIFQSQNNTNTQIKLSTMDGHFSVSDYRTGSWTSDLRVLGSTGDIYIPKINSVLIMKSPDGSCSACGPDNSDAWICTSRSCP